MMVRPLRRSFKSILFAATAVAMLSGCTTVVPYPKVQQPPEKGRITFNKEESTIELPEDANDLLQISMDKGDPLPGDLIGPVEVKDMPLEDVLRLVTRAHKIPIAVGSGAEQSKVSLSIPDALPLAKIVDLLASQAGVFYEYKDGVLHMEGQRNFSIRVPNVLSQEKYKDLTDQNMEESDDSNNNGSSNSQQSNQPQKPTDPDQTFSTVDAFSKTFTDLGATGVSTNKRTGIVSFFADKHSYENVAKFLKGFEQNRDLIIYDAWIYEVQLSDAKQAGINWNDFAKSFGGTDVSLTSGIGTTAAATTSSDTTTVDLPTAGEALRGAGGVTLGVLGTPGAWAVDAMFQFLNNQGSAKTLAQPTISVIGGRESNVYVGESLRYINRLKLENNNNNDNSSTSSDNSSTDVKTARIKTGIELGITGDTTNGIVETDIGLSFVELLSLNNVNVKGWVLQLPRTAERSLNTTVRCRPGDVIMLGGLIYDRGTRSQDNLMAGNAPLGAKAEGNRNELVMMLRPRLIKFRPSKKDTDKAYTEAPLVIGPAVLPKTEIPATSVTTPEAPSDIQMKKSSTSEKAVIDGIKADPTATDLASEARSAISDVLPSQNDTAPAAVPTPAPTQVPSSPNKPAAPAPQKPQN